MRKLSQLSIAIFVLAIGSVIISEYTSPASSQSTGAPVLCAGDPLSSGATCRQSSCHLPGPQPTAASGWITSNIPSSGYTPGTKYTITAAATRAGHSKFGFEVSPQNTSGTVLGTLATLDANTKIVNNQYVTHTQTGTTGSDGSHTWTFSWTAPLGGNSGSVTFYGAFNITNNDNTSSGDTIYTSSITVPQDPATGITDISVITNNISVFPNPVQDKVTITNSQNSEPMQITITDIGGASVKEIENVNNNQSVYVGDLNNGCYVLNIKTKSGIVSKRIIKK